jgi:hypothetical protein
MLKIKIDDTKIKLMLRNMPEELNSALRKTMKQSCADIQEDARRYHRYQTHTGQLENSVRTKVSQSGLTGQVYLDSDIAYYGKYVVHRHGTWDGDPFLENAARNLEDTVKENFARAIKDTIHKLKS